MSGFVERCGCGGAVFVTFDTDGMGGLTEHRSRCLGARCRKRRGECHDCGRRVAGIIGKGVRCFPCGRAHRRKLSRDRCANRTVAQRRHKAEWRQAWVAANPDKVKEYKRREWQRNKDDPERRARYLAACKKANDKRRVEKLEYMKRYNVFGPGEFPTCRDCGAEIPFTKGVGRPHLRCESCAPGTWKRWQGSRH